MRVLHDHIAEWRISIGTTPGGSDIADNLSLPGTATSHTFTGSAGLTYYATLVPVSAAGVSGTPGQSDAGAPNPASPTTAVRLLAANGDEDGDGQSNAAEHIAGTNPFDPTSVLKAISTAISGGDVIVTIATVSGKTYQLETSTTLLPDSWQETGDSHPSHRPKHPVPPPRRRRRPQTLLPRQGRAVRGVASCCALSRKAVTPALTQCHLERFLAAPRCLMSNRASESLTY